MTGAYLRVRRDGKWQSIEIDQMTGTELDELVGEVEEKERLGMWVKFLAAWIRDNIREEEPRHD